MDISNELTALLILGLLLIALVIVYINLKKKRQYHQH